MSIRKLELEIEKMKLDRIIRQERHKHRMEELELKLQITQYKRGRR